MSTQIGRYVFKWLCQCNLELERVRGPSYFCFGFFFVKKSITLQRLQASSIWSRVITICLATFWLPPLQDTPPITMTNLLQAVDFWHGKIQMTYYKRLAFNMDKFWHVVWANLTSYKFSLFFFLFLCIFSKYTMCLLIKFSKVKKIIYKKNFCSSVIILVSSTFATFD
jgi:hypothetical protein